MVKVGFRSPALGRQADYLAYLPPGYHAGGHYPVYYLLHGSPGRPSVYLAIVSIGIRMDNLISERRMRPMILVFPDGRIGGRPFSDSEWANTRAGNYENYVLDVVRDVDNRFATNPSRAGRVIAGFSAGGYGAINIALHHLAVFGGVQSWSGYYRQSRSGVFAHASAATLAYNSPQQYVRAIGRRLATEPAARLPLHRTRRQRQPAGRAHGAGAGRPRSPGQLRAVPRWPRLAAVGQARKPNADSRLPRRDRPPDPR